MKNELTIGEIISTIKTNNDLVDRISKAIELINEIVVYDSSDPEICVINSDLDFLKELNEFQDMKIVENNNLFRCYKNLLNKENGDKK
jgi:hypothetical protein